MNTKEEVDLVEKINHAENTLMEAEGEFSNLTGFDLGSCGCDKLSRLEALRWARIEREKEAAHLATNPKEHN